MCKAAKVTIIEAEEIVEPGEISPNQVKFYWYISFIYLFYDY